MTAELHPKSNRSVYRVIYGDTDQMGVVYYANYLRWFEKGRSEWLREVGRPYSEIESEGLHFPVVEVHCRYFQSARYDEVIVIETALVEVNRASLMFGYSIKRESDDAVLAKGSTKHACIDHDGKIMRMPVELERLLAKGLPTSDRD